MCVNKTGSVNTCADLFGAHVQTVNYAKILENLCQRKEGLVVVDNRAHASLIDRALLALRPLERISKEALHSIIMKQNPTKHSKMPDVVAPSDVVEAAGKEPLWDLAGVQAGAEDVDGEGLSDGRVEVDRPPCATRPDQLDDGDGAGCGEGDVEAYARPRHVGTVESWSPGEDDAAYAEKGGHC